MLNKVLGLSLFVLDAPALAGDFSYNFVEVGYQKVDLDEDPLPGVSVDGDGFGIGGAVEVGESWFITVAYSKVEFDFNIDLDQLGLGVGYHVDMSQNADFFATLSYVRAEASVSGFDSVDEDGFGATIGIRGMVGEKVELTGSIGYVDLGDAGDGTSFGVSGLYNITDAFALSLNIETDDDITGYGIGGRFYFGN
jgi:hypothetical protein